LLLYGEQIKFLCRGKAFSYQSRPVTTVLLTTVPEKSLLVRNEPGNECLLGSGKFGDRPAAGRRNVGLAYVSADPAVVHDSSYEEREFHTTTARIYRTMDIVADASTALSIQTLPTPGRRPNASGLGDFQRNFVPAAKKLFGDATGRQSRPFCWNPCRSTWNWKWARVSASSCIPAAWLRQDGEGPSDVHLGVRERNE